MSFKPSDDVLAGITDMASLLTYAGVSTTTVAASASSDAYVGDLASFLAFLGCAPETHFRILAMLSDADLQTHLPQWRPNGVPPSLGAIAAVKLAWTTARCILQFTPWPSQAATAAAAPAPAPASSGSCGQKGLGPPAAAVVAVRRARRVAAGPAVGKGRRRVRKRAAAASAGGCEAAEGPEEPEGPEGHP